MAKFSKYGTEAERLFVRKGKSPAEVAAALRELFGRGAPSEATIDRWRRRYNWDRKREVYRKSPQSALDDMEAVIPSFTRELRDMVTRGSLSPADTDKANRLADSLSKLTKSIGAVRKEQDILSATVEVMGKFCPYVKANEKDEEVLERLVEHINNFSNMILAGS